MKKNSNILQRNTKDEGKMTREEEEKIAWEEYKKIMRAAKEEYEKIQEPAWEEYGKKLKHIAKKYEK